MAKKKKRKTKSSNASKETIGGKPMSKPEYPNADPQRPKGEAEDQVHQEILERRMRGGPPVARSLCARS